MIDKLLKSKIVTNTQVRSNTFPKKNISNFLQYSKRKLCIIKGVFSKPYKSYSKLIEIFTSYRYLHQMNDYYVARGIVLDLELNALCLVSPAKPFQDTNRMYFPKFINVYIARELLSDKKFMKYFSQLLESEYDFNYIIKSKENIQNLLREKTIISDNLIPLTYEQQEQEERT